VTVSDGVESCSAELSEGGGSCLLGLTTVGDRTLTATYAGSDGFSDSFGTAPHTVEAAAEPTTTSVGVLGPLQ
jgi:hypothetical protein